MSGNRKELVIILIQCSLVVTDIFLLRKMKKGQLNSYDMVLSFRTVLDIFYNIKMHLWEINICFLFTIEGKQAMTLDNSMSGLKE